MTAKSPGAGAKPIEGTGSGADHAAPAYHVEIPALPRTPIREAGHFIPLLSALTLGAWADVEVLHARLRETACDRVKHREETLENLALDYGAAPRSWKVIEWRNKNSARLAQDRILLDCLDRIAPMIAARDPHGAAADIESVIFVRDPEVVAHAYNLMKGPSTCSG